MRSAIVLSMLLVVSCTRAPDCKSEPVTADEWAVAVTHQCVNASYLCTHLTLHTLVEHLSPDMRGMVFGPGGMRHMVMMSMLVEEDRKRYGCVDTSDSGSH